eukprot:scaffold9992_cov79-Skeletonema_dohrnii-CCMP3373.AAC.2
MLCRYIKRRRHGGRRAADAKFAQKMHPPKKSKAVICHKLSKEQSSLKFCGAEQSIIAIALQGQKHKYY